MHQIMKKLTNIFVFLLLSVNIFAQNWQIINQNKSYNYRTPNAQYITNTIRVDSVAIIQSDSVFYLNRIVTKKTMSAGKHYLLRNQPQFLEREIIKKSDNIFVLNNPNQNVILTNLHFGENWLYDSIRNISAVVSYEGIKNVLGTTDSIKTISLSNGKTFSISKNYGITEFYSQGDSSYNLVGVESENNIVGEKLPNFWDFYNWEVGDKFQRSVLSISGGDGFETNRRVLQYKIISKEIIGDTLKYKVKGKKADTISTDHSNEFITTDYSEELIFINSPTHYTNKLNNELVDVGRYFSQDNVWGKYYNRISFDLDDGRLVKKNGTTTTPAPTFFYTVSDTNSNCLLPFYGYSPYWIEVKFTEGLGFDYDWGYFDECGSEHFMGKVHLGDTIGVYYPDYDVINENQNIDFFAYPNPVKNILHINTDEINFRIELFDTKGRLWLSTENNKEISVSDLPEGIYLLKFISEKGVSFIKILK